MHKPQLLQPRRRCAALDTFEAMLQSGCRPHAAVYSSIIDVLWQTGITGAKVKDLALFNSAVGGEPLRCVLHKAHNERCPNSSY